MEYKWQESNLRPLRIGCADALPLSYTCPLRIILYVLHIITHETVTTHDVCRLEVKDLRKAWLAIRNVMMVVVPRYYGTPAKLLDYLLENRNVIKAS
jgi:hypothetical protein